MAIQTPEWVRHAVFYQVFPDRFATSSKVAKPSNLEPWLSKPTLYGFKGGDLLGLAEKLDYLKDLGINAIYLNPIFKSTANHRYHTHDYFTVDPILGGDEAFDTLLKRAHKKEIRIVIDGVFNHASRGFYQFNHALENGACSPYLDWFHIHGFPLHAYEGTPKYDAWWNIPHLPKFNTKTRAVREFLWNVAEHWVHRGIDGWRLDVPAEIDDDEFWREFRCRVKAINPEIYIVGEIWHEAQRWLGGDQFDAVMNYVFTKAAIGFFTQGKFDHHLTDTAGYGPPQKLDAPGFAYSINVMLSHYDKAVNDVQLNLLDSHDTARFLSIAKSDVNAMRLAILCMMTIPGAPCLYYGTEIGMVGGLDPDSRRSFNWDEATWDTDLREQVQSYIRLRKKYRSLRDGDFRVLFAEGMTVAYARAHGDDRAIVALNAGDKAADITIHTSGHVPDGIKFRSALGHRNLAVATNGVFSSIHVPPRSGVVLVAVA
jgi:cyclomaltodextrinase / maltogenic alpha-amylase / neopullulanase